MIRSGRMTVFALGIDLASASWGDNGSALLELDATQRSDRSARAARFVSVVPGAIVWPSVPLTPASHAGVIDAFARSRGVRAVALDGPQGWRDPDTDPELPGVGRRAEHACRTQGKTGTYPKTYPSNQRAWIEHCIAVFDALLEKPNVVLAQEPGAAPPSDGYLLLECFPTSTWRMSGLTPLPGKAKRPALAPFIAALSAAFALPPFSTSSHDDLQGVAAALTAAAALGGPARAILHGVPARSIVDPSGQRRRVEGLIWDAAPLGLPASKVAESPPSPATITAASSAASACVTRAILAEVNRTGSSGSMAIALRGAPAGTRSAPAKVALRIGDAEHVLMVGDTHAVWRSHQTPETEEAFDALFALLAEQPDVRLAIDEVRSPDDVPPRR